MKNECPSLSSKSLLYTSEASFEDLWQQPFKGYEEAVFQQRPSLGNEHAFGTQRVEYFVCNESTAGGYYENEQEQVLSLPCINYQFMIILPREAASSEHPWESYTAEHIKELYATLNKVTDIDLHLVCFTTETDNNLRVFDRSNSKMSNLSRLFSEEFRYPAMFENADAVKLLPIKQKCQFAIGAEGTFHSENLLDVLQLCAKKDGHSQKFITDRPFLYLVYGEKLGIDYPILMGIYE